ncbi:MAG: hypothetical protein DHS20C21_01370 [Gemmatimonadota bacterium]|nr:MAG: hypothetical protein DHS20C21_01370 [Gemmatimonadota bacterium]
MRPEARIPRFHWMPPSALAEKGALVLSRRGVEHGAVRRAGVASPVPNARAHWDASQPLYLPKALTALPQFSGEIRRTRSLFERAQSNRLDFQAEVWRRLEGSAAWVPAGAAVDLADDREIEKVFADETRGGRTTARDLWAKLSWIAREPNDESLRVRFSFGSEFHDDWHGNRSHAAAADRFAQAVFPECGLITDNAPLTDLLSHLVRRSIRLSERIAFANAPGGGARFHHDHETEQRGVVFGQLAGKTAWLALPKRALAEAVSDTARGPLARSLSSTARALRMLDRHDVPALDRLLNGNPRLTQALVDRRALYVLSAGDVLLLPSHGPDDVAWHSVFALGARPSLAHSYGLFAAR